MLVMQLLSIALTGLELLVFSCKWSLKFHLPEQRRPPLSHRVSSIHQYLSTNQKVRRRPKSNLPGSEDSLLPPTAPPESGKITTVPINDVPSKNPPPPPLFP